MGLVEFGNPNIQRIFVLRSYMMATAEMPKKSSWPAIIGQPFITGVLCFLPLVLTLAIVAWLVVFLHDLVGPGTAFGKILSSVGLNFVGCEVVAYVVGLLGTLLIIYIVGLLVERGIGQRYQLAVESALQRVPLVSTVYDASKQLTSMFDRNNEDVKGMTPVMCSFGGEGGAVTLALMPTPHPIKFNDRDYNIVIIPTAPGPFGGALFCIPVEHVKPANCNFDGLVSIFMSMGVSAPEVLGQAASEKAAETE
jgi:uncharacterized membrane protein